jgi:hypothetical protein
MPSKNFGKLKLPEITIRFLIVLLAVINWWIPPKYISWLMGEGTVPAVTHRFPASIERGMFSTQLGRNIESRYWVSSGWE